MITVRTLLKVGDEFVPVEAYSGQIADENYIDGAIELSIDGKELLSRRHWDLVDQLWCYLAQGIVDVSKGQAFSTGFPDSPIDVFFQPDVGRGTVTVKVEFKSNPAGVEATVGLEEFKTVLSAEARRSLDVLGRLAPSNREAYEDVLRGLGAL